MLGCKPGSDSGRYAMLSAARIAWPDDPVGLLGLMLLEDVVLGPGEAVIIPAGCPHAYICGEWAACCCCCCRVFMPASAQAGCGCWVVGREAGLVCPHVGMST